MSKKVLIVLSICFVAAAGIALYVWADSCCSPDALCNGSAAKVGGSDCDYDFEVDLNRDCVDTTTVRLVLHEGGGTTHYYLCQPLMDPPYPVCAPMGVRVQLDPDKSYSYHFETTAGCQGRDPDTGDVLLDPNCD